MDIRINDISNINLSNNRINTIILYFNIRYGHWRFDLIRTYQEIQVLHTQISKLLKKDLIPNLPSYDQELETLKGELNKYFSELDSLPEIEQTIKTFIGRTTATGQSKALDKEILKEGFLKIQSKSLNLLEEKEFYSIIIDDTLYYFDKRVLNKQPCDLPQGLLTLYECTIKKNKKESNIMITSPDNDEIKILCNNEINLWYKAFKNASEHKEDNILCELTSLQQEILNELKENFPDSKDVELQNFLIANSWDLEQTIIKYRAHLQWRKDVRIDDLKINSVYNNLKTGRIFYTGKKDKLGRSILVFRARLHDPSEDFFDTMVLGMYLLEKSVEASGSVGQIVVINDLNGFEKKNNDFRMNKLILEMVLAHFPNRVGAIWCTSTSWVFRMFFKVIKPWLGDELLNRVHLFGGTKELKEFIDDDQLLKDFGGTQDDNIEEWSKERAKIENVSLDNQETHEFGNEEIVAAFTDAPVSHTCKGSIHHGWMKKQGGFVKKFNKRYCVLKGTILYYYRGQDDPKADGVVFLRDSTLAVNESTTFHIITSGGKDCVFQLVNKKDREWIKVLETIIINNGGSIGKTNDTSNIDDPFDTYGISWNIENSKKKKKKKEKSSNKENNNNNNDNSLLYLDELYLMFSDDSLRRFPNGHVPGNEIMDALIQQTEKSKDELHPILSYWILNNILYPASSKEDSFIDDNSHCYIFSFLAQTNVLNLLKITKNKYSYNIDNIKNIHNELISLIKQYQKDDGTINFKLLKHSREYFNFLLSISDLQQIQLDSINDKHIFFYNIRNILLLHSQIHYEIIISDVKSRYKLLNYAHYNIGMLRFSVSDIAHGILRNNERSPESLMAKQFYDKKDLRIKYSCDKSDERLIFALYPGIILDPFYFCSDYNETLDLAMKEFISNYFTIKNNEIIVSTMLTWINEPDKLGFIAKYVDEETKNKMKGSNVILYNINWSKLGLGSFIEDNN